MAIMSIDTIVKRFEAIKSARQQFENHWQEIANYCLPQKANITETRTPGTNLKSNIYDSTAVESAPILSSGLHSYLTNPSSRWFALRMRNKALDDIFEIKMWLKECEDRIFDELNNSNFNEVITEWYSDFAVFGNACLYEEEDEEDGIRFFVRPLSEIYFLTNDNGKIDTVYRSFIYTARQAYLRWGDNAGQKVTEAMKAQKIEEPIPFLQVVLPRHERDVRKLDSANMPFASMYIEPKNRKILSQGGYEEFPFFISRFYKVSDSDYAYSPASMALADIKMLNEMSKTNIEAAQKRVRPPIVLPHKGYLLPFKTTAGALNYKLKSTAGSSDEKIEKLDITGDIAISLEMENQRRQRIERAFFVDLFLMLASIPDKQRTATEIAERVNERMTILGPALGRKMKTLSGIINRTFSIMMRNGRLPLPPVDLRGENYRIEYISPLAKAQKASEIRSINDLIAAIGSIAQVNVQSVDTLDVDKAIKRIADITSTSELLRSDEEVQMIREQRAQQVQAQQGLEQLKTGSEGAKTAVEAHKILTEGGANGGE